MLLSEKSQGFINYPGKEAVNIIGSSETITEGGMHALQYSDKRLLDVSDIASTSPLNYHEMQKVSALDMDFEEDSLLSERVTTSYTLQSNFCLS